MLSVPQQVVGVEVGEVWLVAVVAGGERLVRIIHSHQGSGYTVAHQQMVKVTPTSDPCTHDDLALG